MSRLVMLVSYPKSGNTWVRAFLTSVWAGGRPISINGIRIRNCADRNLCTEFTGINTSDLTAAEIALLRPQVLAAAVAGRSRPLYLKVHDAWMPQIPGVTYPAPAHLISKVVYIARDPREVAISLANHLGISIDAAITALANSSFQIGLHPYGRRPQLPQLLASWTEHVESWRGAFHDRLLLVRYEDLLREPETEFARLVDFLGTRCTRAQVQAAVEAVRFRNLQRAEQTEGFMERPGSSDLFFRAGASDSWKDILTGAQVEQIRLVHRTVMDRLGYT